jgi:hypothetical protein
MHIIIAYITKAIESRLASVSDMMDDLRFLTMTIVYEW